MAAEGVCSFLGEGLIGRTGTKSALDRNFQIQSYGKEAKKSGEYPPGPASLVCQKTRGQTHRQVSEVMGKKDVPDIRKHHVDLAATQKPLF